MTRGIAPADDGVDRVAGGPLDTQTLRTHHGAPDCLCSAAGDGFGKAVYTLMEGAGSGYNESLDCGTP